MRVGNKKIYHLEAWVVKVMSIYKVSQLFLLRKMYLTIISSISSTALIWKTSRYDISLLLLWYNIMRDFMYIVLCIIQDALALMKVLTKSMQLRNSKRSPMLTNSPKTFTPSLFLYPPLILHV